ncbi:MAG: cytochrome c-type biogenesis CcmF C-terminal domain-containing protein, partial [Mucilaginibacter sp.]
NTGHSYVTAAILILLSFVMVLYESFLARSGILGDTSVHAFTDLGMFGQLISYILIFLVISVYLLIARWKELPITKKDEETYSREFWMFVGAVFLSLSCFHLVLVTSIPVWNRMFGTKIAPPTDLVTHYNIIQAAFAVVITLLTGFTQFLKYKKTDVTRFFIITIIYLVFAALVTALVVYTTGLYKLHFVYQLVMFGAVYSISVNGKVLADAINGKFKLAGSAVAHIGFGLMLVGALIAAGTRKVVSENDKGIGIAGFDKAGNERENIMIYKNEPYKMGEYVVTYVGDSVAEPNHYYKVNYKRFDDKGKLVEEFLLKPNVQINPQMGLTPSPDTKHYLLHDLYTHITALPPIKEKPADATADAGHGGEDDDKNYDAPITHEVAPGDTIRFREGYMILAGLNKNAKVQDIPLNAGDIAIGAKLEIVSHDKTYEAEPVYMIRKNSVFDFARKVDDVGLKLRFSKILPEQNKVEITVYQQPESKKPWIVMSALDFPYINFLWAGTIIMVIGFLISLSRRNKELKTV